MPELAPDLRRIHELVVDVAASAGGPIGNALSQYVARPGKMLRPGFVLIGSWAGRGRPGRPADDRIVRIAAAIEVLHLATLIHDDVIDDADRRRGEPSLHALYGRKQAVLMGDFLLSRCFSIIAEGTERENALRLAAAVGHLVRGEINQMFEAGGDAFSRRAYLRRIAGKTATLFGLSLVTGASETKTPPAQIAKLARAGYNLGMAFQVIDDILDFTARPDAIGKPVAADLRAGIYTLPVIAAVAREPRIREVVVPPPSDEKSLREAVDAIRTAGGLSAARSSAAAYTSRAHRAIGALGEPRLREALGAVAGKLVDREY
ncbi:MAG: polyprenyl synthetase family protein [Spirochaetota bacterium]